jgi:hypothetical protein
MKTPASIARILLGVTFVVFGLNGFLHFLPQPAMPPAAGAFFGALAATGYIGRSDPHRVPSAAQ